MTAAATDDSATTDGSRPRSHTPGAWRVVEWKLAGYRHLWTGLIVTSFLEPLLYLTGMGLGVGSLVNRNRAAVTALGGVSYARFIAPALLATTAMVIATIESSYPVLSGFRWTRTYHAMAATPLRPRDLVHGHVIWISLRVLVSTAAVALAMELVPSTRAASLPLATAGAVLCGLAFALPMATYSAWRQNERGFVAFQRFGLVPMQLFGGTFYPVTQLPAPIRSLAYATPAWHGVELCRALALHRSHLAAALGHTAYLLVFVIGGTVACRRVFDRRLGA